jgi:rubrerythrin
MCWAVPAHDVLNKRRAIMDILTVLRKLGDLERDMGNVYEWLATVFSGDEQAVEFFHKLAQEEQSHLNLVKYQERVVRKTPGEFAGVEISLPALDKAFQKIAEFRKTNPMLKDALQFALEMETDVSEHYAATVMIQSNESFAQMVKGLMEAQKDEHYKRLLEFARNYPG